jgi:hypothetical protein
MDKRMKYYSYVEPLDDEMNPATIVMSEKEILAEYYDYWCTRMREVGKEDEISEQKCIEDWCIVHWALPEPIYKANGNYYIVDTYMDEDQTGDLATFINLSEPDNRSNIYMRISEMEEVDEAIL